MVDLRISIALDIQRSTIYYARSDHTGKRKPRITKEIGEQVLRIAEERISYGYRRIWALMRDSGIHVNMKTVRRIMRNHNLALPYGKHKNRTGKRELTKPAHINMLWETDIHYVITSRDGMAYLMSIKDCFSKKWVSYEFFRSCTASDCIRAVEKAYATSSLMGKTVQILHCRLDPGGELLLVCSPVPLLLRMIYALTMCEQEGLCTWQQAEHNR